MGSIGMPELIIIFVVALIVFGPRKLPELGKSLGKGLAEFRRASNELKATIEDEVRAIEAETTTHLNSKASEPEARQEPTASDLSVETDSRSTSRSSSDVNVDAH